MPRQLPEERFNEAIRKMIADSPGRPKLAEMGALLLRQMKRDAGSLRQRLEEEEPVETTEAEDEKKEAGVLPPPPHINLFQHPDTNPAVLDILLLRKYGPEWMLWEPETLAMRIPLDFHTGEVSDLNMHKIQAMKTLHVVDSPWTQWEVFVWTAMAVNNLFPDFEVMQVPTVSQCLIAIDTFNTVRQDVTWSDELEVYLGTVWKHEGLLVPLEPATFITIDREGTDIDVGKIEAMWPDVRRTGKAPSGDTLENEQLRRMLEAHEQLQESRELLERQWKQVLDG